MRKPKGKTASKANPKAKVAGLRALIEHNYAERPDSDYLDLAAAAGARLLTEMDRREEAQSTLIQQEEALRERNRTGALVRAGRYLQKKQIVRQVYDDLKAKRGNKPSRDLLLDTLIKKHKEHKWSGNTISKWIAKLNKGEDI